MRTCLWDNYEGMIQIGWLRGCVLNIGWVFVSLISWLIGQLYVKIIDYETD